MNINEFIFNFVNNYLLVVVLIALACYFGIPPLVKYLKARKLKNNMRNVNDIKPILPALPALPAQLNTDGGKNEERN